MKNFKFVISTPDGNFFEGDIVSVSLRGAEGDLAVMAGHTPFVTSVKPCKAHIELDDGDIKYFTVERGLLTVKPDSVILMSGSAVWE